MKWYLIVAFVFIGCLPAKNEQPITKAEAISHAKDIEARFKKGDKNRLNNVLDEDLFADEIAKASGLKQGIKERLKRQNLSRQVYNSPGETGSYQIIKQYEKK